MNKFTPGPWELETKAASRVIAPAAGAVKYASVTGKKGKRPFVVHNYTYTDTPLNSSEQIANAHLIAAAPDMYEALVELESLLRVENPAHHGNPKLHTEACKANRARLNAAIAKARGVP